MQKKTVINIRAHRHFTSKIHSIHAHTHTQQQNQQQDCNENGTELVVLLFQTTIDPSLNICIILV